MAENHFTSVMLCSGMQDVFLLSWGIEKECSTVSTVTQYYSGGVRILLGKQKK